MSIQTQNELFLAELERLNPAQKEAVDTIEGPVLVVAGPGTGKTHILAARIGRILLETDTQPHNILCLTFTDAGVQAMRRRLLSLIGPEAHRVHVFTFHSFCNNIIQSNLERFGRRDLEPLSDLEKVEIVRKILEELPPRHILRGGRADAFFYERHLQDLFQKMKTEAWAVDLVHEKIDEYLSELPERKEFVYQVNRGNMRKGDLKQAKVDDEILRMERLRQAASLFPRYLDLMAKMRRYDYADMILWVLRAFDENPGLLRTYQEQYLYFLVDEFQDTNGAQNEVLRRLIEYWDSPNVFIVGDDDQSIYEFQGARLKNLVEFHSEFPELRLVVLDHNYRSSQNILDASRELIERNAIRIVNSLGQLGIQKILEAKNTDFAKAKIQPTIIEFPDRLQEEVAIVEQLKKLQSEGFPMEEVAVIFARHRQATRLMELLDKSGVAYQTRRSLNALDLPLIQNLRLLLEYLHIEFHEPFSGEHLLVRLMHLGCFGIPPLDLAKFATALSSEEKMNWREIISDKDTLKKYSTNPTPFQALSAFIENMLATYPDRGVPAFIEAVVNRSGLLSWVMEHEGAVGVQALFAFFSFAKKEAERNPRLSLGRFLELLKNMDDNRIQLAVSQLTIGVQPKGDEAKKSNLKSRINLLTAHSSKGLEFQKVFLIDCLQDQWGPNKRRGQSQFKFPDTLSLSGEEDAEEARRRLFYVAMTRAKESLQFSYARTEGTKDLERVIFIDELLRSPAVKMEEKEAPFEAVETAQFSLLLETKPNVQPLDPQVAAELLEGFALSVSSMNKFLRCPLSFYYENVLRVPVLVSEAAWFGIAMHDALYRGFEKMLGNKRKVFPSGAGFTKLFAEEMKAKEGFFGKKEYARRMLLGKQYLKDYVEQFSPAWRKTVEVEKAFQNVEVEGVPLTGIIDRIDLLGDLNVHIVDYKTGSHQAKKLAKPTEKNPHGGSYWRQLVFYKILFENWRNNPRLVQSAEISYLEPDKHGKFVRKEMKYRPEDVGLVKKLIVDTYAKIQRQEFYEGCGEDNCQWCNFLKNQSNVTSFSEREIEELDDRN